MSDSLVNVERRDGGVALVELNRPEKRNALSIDLRFELADTLDALGADEEMRCAVITGAGPAFCAGMDVTQFGGDDAHRQKLVESSERWFDSVARFPLPLIAAVNGHAVAGGFVLALLCDARIAAAGASFGFPEVGKHIPPSYAAARAALPPALARWMVMTGQVVEADEAHRLGIVSEVVDDPALRVRALEVATQIAKASPWTCRELKRRILQEHERILFPLMEDEARILRERVLGRAT
jgi:enoyl-CoA hydratase